MLKETVRIRGVDLTGELLNQVSARFSSELLELVDTDVIRLQQRCDEIREAEASPEGFESFESFERFNGAHPLNRLLELGEELIQQRPRGSYVVCSRGLAHDDSGRSWEWGDSVWENHGFSEYDGNEKDDQPEFTTLTNIVSARLEFQYHSFTEGVLRLELNYLRPDLSISFQSRAARFPALIPTLSAQIEAGITDEMRRALRLTDRIFIGHGGDSKWEAVRDFLGAAGYSTEAFESKDRTGQATFHQVLNMISSARIAVIVMSACDRLADDNRLLARQNVIHEIGLAQGILGAENTIILKEESAEEFSNIAGITQIRFPDGDVYSSKDKVLAAVIAKLNDLPATPVDPQNWMRAGI